MLYEPREDSYLVLKYIKEHAKGKVLDMCTGSGILAAEAQKYAQNVLAADIDPAAVDYVKKLGIKAIVSDLFSNVPKSDFDLIICNPPYLPEDPNEPPDSARATTAGKKGHELIERFLREAKDFLKSNGKILLVFSSFSGNIEKIAQEAGYKLTLLDQEAFDFEKIYLALLTKNIL